MFGGILATCHSFVELTDSFTKLRNPINDDDSSANHPSMIPTGVLGLQSLETTATRCHQLSETFLHQLQNLMDMLQVMGVSETPRLSGLVCQLDFNGFYRSMVPQVRFVSNPAIPIKL